MCQLGGIRAVATTAVVGRVPSGLLSVAWTLSSLCGRAFVCAQDLNGELPSFRWAPSHLRVLRIGSDWTTAAPLTDSPELRRGGSVESTAARAWKAAGSSLSLASSLQPPQIRPARCLLRVPSFAPFCQMSTQMHAAPRAGYVLGRTADEPGNSFGAGAWPVLCGAIQGAAILVAWMHVMREAGRSLRWEVLACEAQPVFVAARLVVAERLLMPLAFILPLWGTFLLLLGLLFLEQFVRVGLLVTIKWLLIGRYKEGEHDIYSLMYLRHWLVEHLAKGTIVGQNAHQGSSIAFLFMRNLALKALGADVSLSSVITARVVAFDLVSVGDLATVHGPRHLTAVNYGSRRMVLQRVKVGAGAYVGPNCTLEPGCEVALLWVLLRLLLLLLLLLHLSPSKAPSLPGGRRGLRGAVVHRELRHHRHRPRLWRACSAGGRARPRSAADAGRGPPLPQSRGSLRHWLLVPPASKSAGALPGRLLPAAVARRAAVLCPRLIAPLLAGSASEVEQRLSLQQTGAAGRASAAPRTRCSSAKCWDRPKHLQADAISSHTSLRTPCHRSSSRRSAGFPSWLSGPLGPNTRSQSCAPFE